MTPRTRVVAFGSAGLLTAAGVLCFAFGSGVAGLVVAAALLSLGLGLAVLLVFLEVGLSEDHARAREEQESRPARPERPVQARRPRRPRR